MSNKARAELKAQLKALMGVSRKPTDRCGPNTIETTGALFSQLVQGGTLGNYFTPANDQDGIEGVMGQIVIMDEADPPQTDEKTGKLVPSKPPTSTTYTVWVDPYEVPDLRSLNR